MSKFYTHLKSEIPATIYANGEYVGVCNKQNSLDLEVTTNNVYFNVSPVGNYYPYTIHIFNHNRCVDTTNNSLIVPYYNNNYDIYLSHIKIQENRPTTTLYNGSVGNFSVSILNSIQTLINIYINNNLIYSDNIKLLNKVTVEQLFENLIIKGLTTDDEYYVLILDKLGNVIHSGYFDNIEETNNVFTGFSNIYDMAKHGHICEINLQNVKDVKDYFVVKENLKLCSTAELIPQAFLEALKVKNFTLAKSYLANPLSNASNNHFDAYFGPIQAIYYNCYNNSNPINYTVYNGEYKFYNFVVKDNKICDIEECYKV